MDATYVGIDVSRDRLDVHVWPAGVAFAVTRDGKRLEDLQQDSRSVSYAMPPPPGGGG
jgi:transposase